MFSISFYENLSSHSVREKQIQSTNKTSANKSLRSARYIYREIYIYSHPETDLLRSNQISSVWPDISFP